LNLVAVSQCSQSLVPVTDCQPQYPDLQGDFNADFTGLQAVFNTIRSLPDLTRHLHAYYSVIEEFVEGFVEGFLGTVIGLMLVVALIVVIIVGSNFN
jgi:hypothetical protein